MKILVSIDWDQESGATQASTFAQARFLDGVTAEGGSPVDCLYKLAREWHDVGARQVSINAIDSGDDE